MSAWDNLLENIKNILNKVNINDNFDIESLTTYDCEKKLVKNSLVYFHGHVYKVINVGYVEKNKLEPLDRFNFLNGAELVDILNPNNRGIRKFEYLSKGVVYLIKFNTLNESKIIQHNKPVSFIAYHGSVEDDLELAPNKAFYLCASYKLAKEFAYREVYSDGLYEGDVPMIYKFKGTFKNPYYMTEEEYDDEGQDSNIDFQKWVDMGVDGIVLQNRQTYYIVIDPSTIRLIGKKYLPFDEESLKRTDDQNNDKDDMPMINEEVDYQNEVEILLNPSTNEFKHFMKPKHWYRMCLDSSTDNVFVWDANTPLLHQNVDELYGLKDSVHLFVYNLKPYIQDYDLDEYNFADKEAFLDVAKSIDSNALYKKYFPNHSMVNDLKKAFENNGKYIAESIVHAEMNDDDMLVILHNPTRKELKDNHLDDECRLISDGNNGYYFASSEWTHEQIEQKLQANNLPYSETSGEFYYYQDNLFTTRDDWSSEEEYQEYKNDWYQSLKSMPYIVKNFGNFKVEIFKGEYLSEDMSNYIQLNEGIEDVKRYFPKITNEDFTKLINLDPTYQGGNELGKYGKWILGLYNTFLKDKEAYQKWEEQKKLGNNFPEPTRKSQEQIEDFEKIPAILKDFEVMNKKLRVNINNVKSIAELYKIVNDAKNEGISNNSKVNHVIDLVKKSIEKGGEVVFKDSNWIVLIPKTLESSVVFGDDTNWCTTASNGRRYRYYKKNYGGEYYINVNLKDGSLYQFHLESNQFMDKNDDPIRIIDFLNNNTSLFSFYKKHFGSSLVGKWNDGIIFVDNPSEEVQLKSVLKNGMSIQYIKNPSEAVQLAAVKKWGGALEFIKNPSEEMQLIAVKMVDWAIKFIENPSEQVQLKAVKQNGYSIRHIKNPSEQVQLAAVRRDGRSIQFIENPSEQMQLEAVRQDGRAIQFIENPSEQIQLAAVQENGNVIQYIKNPSEQIQLSAVQENGYAIEYIENPTDKVKVLYNKLYGKLNESNEQYISESVFDYGTPMIFPDPTYSEFHRIMRDHTTYGKLSAVIDRGHIYCWDSGMAHHHQMIKHIENQIGERLSDNAIWVRFKEPNWVWVSAEYFNEYDDDELDDLGTQDFEKELENNPIIKKYFPRGIVIKRFNNLVESFKKVSDDSYVMEITSYNDIKPFIQRYCSFGARGLLNTNNNKVYLADVMALTHGDMVNDLKENGESIDYDSVIQFMVYPSQETALDSEYAEYWNEGDDRIQFVTNDDIYVLFKQYNFMNDRLNKILKMNTMDDVEREDDMNGFVITESIHFNDMAYNNAFNKFEELTVWKNPSIDWLQNELENIDLRFIYNPDANMLYVWNGSKWMHSEVMDNVDMKMSSNVNIIGVLSPSVVEIWAEISPTDNANEAKSLTRKYMGKLLKDIYPNGYQLIAYT